MAGKTIESPYLKQLHERLSESCQRARSLTEDLNTSQLNWKPGDDKWSIAQCLEHTLIGADRYAEQLRPIVERARGNRLRNASDLAPRHTLMGRLIMRAVEPTATRTMSTPKIFSPAQSEISRGVVDKFVQSHENIAQLVLQCDGLNLNKLKLSSPVARIIRINAADAFEILVTHAKRHLNQAGRVRESQNFPT